MVAEWIRFYSWSAKSLCVFTHACEAQEAPLSGQTPVCAVERACLFKTRPA